ncbi:MAG: hypothetical protein WC370_02755 [Dehalococcoidales bacterium]
MTRKIALGIFLLAIIFFLMPWVNVSCMGTNVASASGLDMVRGVYNVPGEYTDTPPQSEPLAMWALIAAGVGLLVSLFTGELAFLLRILSGLAGIGLLIALKIKLGNDFNNTDSLMGTGTAGMIQLNYLPGYWLTLISFALAAIVSAIKKDFKISITKTPESPPSGAPPPADKPPPT